jgi:hypothetical protein
METNNLEEKILTAINTSPAIYIIHLPFVCTQIYITHMKSKPSQNLNC